MENLSYTPKDMRALKIAMSLSLIFGVAMLAIKIGAYLLTGSAAILSDAAESVVHIAAVAFAAYSLWLSFKPADATHLYGHEKISFFSAGIEGILIIIAAIYIIYEAVSKWLGGLHLENLSTGSWLTALAAVLNAGLGGYLIWLGKKKHSLILEANGKHVLTDSWTSVGVLVGLGLTMLTGWLPWDPICAIIVALNILYSGFGLMKKSIGGLMDKADPKIQQILENILEEETKKYHIDYHELKHRSLGNTYWVEVHLLFPGDVPIREAHRIATEIENRIEGSLKPAAVVSTHLESMEDHQEVHINNRHNL
jgi:cation diffusion facilitator family transporter